MSNSNKSFFDEETEPSWTLRRPSLLPHPSDLVEPWFHKDDNNKDMEDNKTKRFADIWHTPSEEGDAKWIAVHQRFEQRRLSLRPPTVSLLENTSLLEQRRHSLAAMSSLLAVESLSVAEKKVGDTVVSKVDMEDMGKGTRLDSDELIHAVFCVVEFKGGRWDVFYSLCGYQKNGLVIVEADRGHDLGKVSMEHISRDQLKEYYTLLKNINHNTGELNTGEKVLYQHDEIYIKCIIRSAMHDEITLLMAKGQDESKALMVCQSKIKQKKLNMQVVEAEYQWDRRKLTFYFIAEKRVDFRELVRELFKLYKTRIWMCAVNSIKAL